MNQRLTLTDLFKCSSQTGLLQRRGQHRFFITLAVQTRRGPGRWTNDSSVRKKITVSGQGKVHFQIKRGQVASLRGEVLGAAFEGFMAGAGKCFRSRGYGLAKLP